MLAVNAEKPGLVPEQKGVIRASAPIGGWRLEPLEGDPTKTKASYMSELDLKGNIPGFVMKKANTDQGYQIVLLRKVVEQFLKENSY